MTLQLERSPGLPSQNKFNRFSEIFKLVVLYYSGYSDLILITVRLLVKVINMMNRNYRNVNIKNNDIITRQIDKYDGQKVIIKNEVVYELGNFLGNGASGVVYEAAPYNRNLTTKQIAIKILNPLGYKTWPASMVSNRCVIVLKGELLPPGNNVLASENVWWLYNLQIKQVIAAYQDPTRNNQLRELTLTKCVEIWGFYPFGVEQLSDCELDKLNISPHTYFIDGVTVTLPRIPVKYIKWLKNREMICREMKNMTIISGHPNVIELHEVLELIQDTKTTLFLVLDFASGGMLFERVKSNLAYNTLSEEFARKYFIQLLSGIEYCHSKG